MNKLVCLVKRIISLRYKVDTDLFI